MLATAADKDKSEKTEKTEKTQAPDGKFVSTDENPQEKKETFVSTADHREEQKQNHEKAVKEALKEQDGPNKIHYSDGVVALRSGKTPAELAAETPAEAEARYGPGARPSEEDLKNPRVQVYEDDDVYQVPSGTHLHPDVAKDLANRGIVERGTDNAQVKRTVTEYHDFAPDAEFNDKF